MHIKYTTLGFLIYIAMTGYIIASLSHIMRSKKVTQYSFLGAFIFSAAAFFLRWHHVRHVPMQNLFEVFLSLSMLIYPISVFCRKTLNIDENWADMMIGFIILFPAGFIFTAEPRQLPPALQSWLFAPHVAVYMLSYIFMAKAAFQASMQLFSRNTSNLKFGNNYEKSTYKMVCAGFPLLTAGLLLGSFWGKLAWGDYWGWDPKELWSLAGWLTYVAYFHFRYTNGTKYPKINSLWALTGLVIIIITLLWVNLSRLFAGLHSYA